MLISAFAVRYWIWVFVRKWKDRKTATEPTHQIRDQRR